MSFSVSSMVGRVRAQLRVRAKRVKLMRGKKRLQRGLSTSRIAQGMFLAREALLTKLFVERVQRQSNRPIVVVPIGRTGEPYLWGLSIKPATNVQVAPTINYPSGAWGKKTYEPSAAALLKHFETGNPIIVCVDSSTSPRMPASFVGKLSDSHTPPEWSLKSVLERNGVNVKVIGYNYSQSTTNKVDRLPKIPTNELTGRTVILLNPSKSTSKKIQGETWKSADHDDVPDIADKIKPFVMQQLQLSMFKKQPK